MGEALLRMALGYLTFAQGEVTTAAPQLEASFQIFTVLWQGAAAMCRALQAQVALAESRLDDAERWVVEALTAAATTDNVNAKAWAGEAQARLAQLAGDPHRAEDIVVEAIDLATATARPVLLCDLLDGLASAVADQQRADDAARFLGAADSLRAALQCPRHPVHAAANQLLSVQLRDALGPQAFDAAMAAGADLSLDDALAYLRRGRGGRKRPTHGWASLTPTELQIVELVADGLTNPQIGERMFISRRTVQAHLAHVFPKLGVASRAQLAARVVERRAADA